MDLKELNILIDAAVSSGFLSKESVERMSVEEKEKFIERCQDLVDNMRKASKEKS